MGYKKKQSHNEMVGPTHKDNQILFIWKIDEHNNKFEKGWPPGS